MFGELVGNEWSRFKTLKYLIRSVSNIGLLMLLLLVSERTFIVLDKDFIKGELIHGEPHVEGLFLELLHLRNRCIKEITLACISMESSI